MSKLSKKLEIKKVHIDSCKNQLLKPKLSKKLEIKKIKKVKLKKETPVKAIVNLKKENTEKINKKYHLEEFIDSPISLKIINTVLLNFVALLTCIIFFVLENNYSDKIDIHGSNFFLFCFTILSFYISYIGFCFYEFVDKNELNDDTLKFLGYNNKFDIDSINIPEVYFPNDNFNYKKKKYAITSIKEGLFKNCKKLKKVTISDFVSKIGSEAFSGCTKIENIKVSDNVTEIGKNAFYGVQNVVYNGFAIGAPWGAKSINGEIL